MSAVALSRPVAAPHHLSDHPAANTLSAAQMHYNTNNGPLLIESTTTAALSPASDPKMNINYPPQQALSSFGSEVDLAAACTPSSNASWDAGSVDECAADLNKTSASKLEEALTSCNGDAKSPAEQVSKEKRLKWSKFTKTVQC